MTQTNTKILQKPRKPRHRTRNMIRRVNETDGQYLLKLVIVILFGTFWLKFAEPLQIGAFTIMAIPLGAIVGLLLIRQLEKIQENRKIWYAILLVVTIICSMLPAGILI